MIRTRSALFVALLAALVLTAGPSFAQFDGNFAELVFQGGAVQPIAEDGTAPSYSLGTGIAIRTTPKLRLGAEFAFSGIGLNDETETLMTSLGVESSTSILEYGAFARYHLEGGMAGPYLKGSVGARQMRASFSGLGMSGSASETVLGYSLGLGWMLQGAGDLATFFEAEYGHAFPAEFSDAGGSAVDGVGFDMLKLSMGAMFGAGF